MEKFIGGILLIVGTSIGGGMLALPIASAAGGYLPAFLTLFICWMIMTSGALLILEVNLLVPVGCNLVTMAKQTLGRTGKIATWIIYLFLLYTLLSAYTAGGADVFHGLVDDRFGIDLPQWVSACIFVAIFSSIVMLGIRVVDYVNRVLMGGKFIVLFILILLLFPLVKYDFLKAWYPMKTLPAVTVMLTSFGFATIVPSLRAYFKDDVESLRKAIIIGSLIPLVCYIFWLLTTLGTIPREGQDGLLVIQQSSLPVTGLANTLSAQAKSKWITTSINLFTSICALTSFLAVSLGLSDFLADGFNVKKKGKNAILVFAVTFLPPLFIVIFYPKAFLHGLSFAGIFCILLLVMLPALMAWFGRKQTKEGLRYQLLGGRALLVALMLIGILIILYTLVVKYT